MASPDPDSESDSGNPIPVRRVRNAYEQVADQLRDLIVSGALPPAERLPSEGTLATQFGVSRTTIREALRSLSSQNLIRTAKGATGGSFVSVPTVANISDALTTNIGLLSQSESISLTEFLETRELLEVPAARLAARRGSPESIRMLRAAIPSAPLEMSTETQFVLNRDFHSTLVAATGNTLLSIAAQPVFSILQTNLQRSALGTDFHEAINHDHHAIVEALEAGDEERAAAEMHDHLEYLRPVYEQAWRYKL